MICEFTGEVLDQATTRERIRRYQKEGVKCLYMVALDANHVLDAHHKGSFARFINHCCEPNCILQRWEVMGEDRLGVFAMKPIAKGEEITFDYKMTASQVGGLACYCGAPTCSGIIGEKPFYAVTRDGIQHGQDTSAGNQREQQCFQCRSYIRSAPLVPLPLARHGSLAQPTNAN